MPSLAVTWCVRRWLGGVSWAHAALLLLLAFVFTGPTVVTSDMPVPLDEVMRGYPYRGVVGEVHPRNPLTNDTVKQILPWMDAVRREFAHGRLPVWNPYAFGGYPLLGNGQSAPFAPVFLATLFVPLPKQLVAMAGVKLFVAMLFTFLVARREGAGVAGSVAAAVIFGYSVFQNVYLYYPLTTVTSLFPAAVFAVRERYFGLLAVVTAAVLAGGHPESAVHIGVGCLLFLRKPRLLLAVLLGVVVSAVVWVPVFQQALASTRFHEIGAVGRQMTPEFPLSAARTLLYADAFGNPARGNWHGPLNYSMVAPNYLGALTLVCLVVGLFKTRRDRLLVLACVALFLISMNWTPLAKAINSVSIVANDRLRFVVAFLAAIVTARVLPDKRVTWLAALLVAADLWLVNAVFNAPAPTRFYEPRTPLLDRLQQLKTAEPFRILGFDWVLLPNASTHYGLEDIRGSDPMGPAAYARFFELVAAHDPSSDVKRVQNANQPGIDFLNVKYLLTEPEFEPGGAWIERYRGPDGRLYENPNVLPRFFAPAIAEPFRDFEQLRGISDFRNRVLIGGNGFVNPVCGTDVTTTTDRPTRLEVTINTCAPTLIASSQSNARGWRVRINDQPVRTYTVNGAFLGFIAPAGRSRAVVEYRLYARE